MGLPCGKERVPSPLSLLPRGQRILPAGDSTARLLLGSHSGVPSPKSVAVFDFRLLEKVSTKRNRTCWFLWGVLQAAGGASRRPRSGPPGGQRRGVPRPVAPSLQSVIVPLGPRAAFLFVALIITAQHSPPGLSNFLPS